MKRQNSAAFRPMRQPEADYTTLELTLRAAQTAYGIGWAAALARDSGLSRSTINKLASGAMRLSEKSAERIYFAVMKRVREVEALNGVLRPPVPVRPLPPPEVRLQRRQDRTA
ncbi:hypothetical protein [Gluconobacter oxydans]|uniref:hypothetical protein n=1 Tax=Gluconobacter oxydans TaxID=442 RepID=UPI0039ED3DB0